MKTVHFLPFFKQKSFSTGIQLFLICVFVNLEGTFLRGLALTVLNSQRRTSGSTQCRSTNNRGLLCYCDKKQWIRGKKFHTRGEGSNTLKLLSSIFSPCNLVFSPCRYPLQMSLSYQHISIYVLITSSLHSFPTPSLLQFIFFSLWLHQYSLNEIDIFKILPVIRNEVEKFHQFSSTISSSFLNRGKCNSFMWKNDQFFKVTAVFFF